MIGIWIGNWEERGDLVGRDAADDLGRTIDRLEQRRIIGLDQCFWIGRLQIEEGRTCRVSIGGAAEAPHISTGWATTKAQHQLHGAEGFQSRHDVLLVAVVQDGRPEPRIAVGDYARDMDRGLDITKSIMGIVCVEAVCRGKTVQLERRAAGIIGRPMHQTGIAAPDSKDGGQDVEPIVAVELRGIDVRLKVLEEGLAQHLLIEPDAVEAHPCRRRPTFGHLHDRLGELEQGRQLWVNQLRGRDAGDNQRLWGRDDVWRDPAAQVDALDLDKTVVRTDRCKLQRLIKCGRYPGGLKIVKDKSHQRTLSNKQVASAPLPAARAAAHDPIRAAIGDCINKHFGGVIVNNEGNDGFAPCRDGTQTRGDFISKTSLVGRGLQRGDGSLDFGQLSRRRDGPSIVEDPTGDNIKITRDEGMVPDAVVHAPRAAPMVRRAAAKASFWSMNVSRGVSMRARISCARAERATSRSCSSCIICSSAAATAALWVANTPCPTFSERNWWWRSVKLRVVLTVIRASMV